MTALAFDQNNSNTTDHYQPENKCIEKSWATIKGIEASIVCKSQDLNWKIVKQYFSLRQRHISIHFKNFPVGPNNAFFYKKHLSEYFKSEEYFQELHNQATRNHLCLV